MTSVVATIREIVTTVYSIELILFCGFGYGTPMNHVFHRIICDWLIRGYRRKQSKDNLFEWKESALRLCNSSMVSSRGLEEDPGRFHRIFR